MLKNMIAVALRSFSKFKTYSFINVFGLAIGFASAMVIGLWVYQEWSYDRHFDQSDRIFRIGVNFMNVGDLSNGPPQFNEFARDFPEVARATSLDGPAEEEIRIGDEIFKESRVFRADSLFFDLFSYDFVVGDRSRALNDPDGAVLTQATALKYFGTTAALGRTLLVGEDQKPFVVTGVIDIHNHKSHIQADIWLSQEPPEKVNWTSAYVYNYVLLKDGFSKKNLDDRLHELIKTQVYPSLSTSVPFDEWLQAGLYYFIPIRVDEIYLTSTLRFEPAPVGSKSNVITFGVIAVLIILIAGVNYVNITTARASIRAKEVGVRKTLGSSKLALVLQFLSESMMICGLALLIAIGLGELFLRIFENITGLSLLENLFPTLGQLATVILIAVVIGLAAGLYPAFYLTLFEPVQVLKGQFYSRTGSRSRFRNALVLLQFGITICLLVGTTVVYKQLDFMRNRDLGLGIENVLILRNANQLGNQKLAFKNDILSYSDVVSASYNKRVPAGGSIWVHSFRTESMEEGLPMQTFIGDHDMMETLGFRITAGRYFSPDLASDTAAVILNQSAVSALGLQDPIGAILNSDEHVIGVVADFNFESMRKQIEPVAIKLDTDGYRFAVKLRGNQTQAFVQFLESKWQQYGMTEPLQTRFLDENYERLMQKERILSKAVVIFTILAVVISCLGLYGLSAYMTELRTKEISIRRVFGGSVSSVTSLLSKEFVKLVMLANLIAWPVAWVATNSWLQNFAYRIEVSWWIFIFAGGLALMIALMTVWSQAIRAAMMNPVKALRYE